MPVRGGARNVVRRHDAAGARLVLDHHLLAEVLGDLRRDGARHQVGDAARTEGHHQADRLGREGLGRGESRYQRQGDAQE
jgi:hypothetical protein